jgi:hypothetical protein
MRSSFLVMVMAPALFCLFSMQATAADVYLPSGYARIDNYQGAYGGYCGMPQDPSSISGVYSGFSTWTEQWARSNTSAITVNIKNKVLNQTPSSDPTQNCLYFKIGGTATVGQSSAYYPSDMRVGGQEYYHMTFDWTTSFGYSDPANYLRLEIPGGYLGTGFVWSITPGLGYHHGHVDMDIPYDYHVPGICFTLSVVNPVPEPSALATMVVGLTGSCLLRRYRRS